MKTYIPGQPNGIKLPYTCKLCGQPGVVTMAPESDEHATTQWFGMLTHDRCYDRVTNFRKAGDELVRVACVMAQSQPGQSRAALAKSLPALARRYAEAFAAKHNTPLVFHPDFYEMIIASPEKIGRILAEYRKQVLNIPQEFATEEA
jgi:hypothetical protein